MRILTTTQRTPEWFAARLGMLTGSRAVDVFAKIKIGEAAARRNYRVQLVLERLTGVSQESDYVSKDMQYGIDREADAFAAYEAVSGNLTVTAGFIAHDMLMAGCSIDGVVGDFEGILELKCRKSANHLDFLRSGKIPWDATLQITHNLWITGAQWADYVSFDDRFMGALQLKIMRVERVQADIDAYELVARQFLREVEAECEAVRALALVTA